MITINRIKFVFHPPGADRIHYINKDDIKIVLSRLPSDTYKLLKEVIFNDQSWGARIIGFISNDNKTLQYVLYLHELVYPPS